MKASLCQDNLRALQAELDGNAEGFVHFEMPAGVEKKLQTA